MSGTVQTTLEITTGDVTEPRVGEDYRRCPNCRDPIHKNQWPQHVGACDGDGDGGESGE